MIPSDKPAPKVTEAEFLVYVAANSFHMREDVLQAAINVLTRQAHIKTAARLGPPVTSPFQIGDRVTFCSGRTGDSTKIVTGTIIRLNPKTVTVRDDASGARNMDWRVSRPLLKRVPREATSEA
jgi:hypothetical protein